MNFTTRPTNALLQGRLSTRTKSHALVISSTFKITLPCVKATFHFPRRRQHQHPTSQTILKMILATEFLDYVQNNCLPISAICAQEWFGFDNLSSVQDWGHLTRVHGELVKYGGIGTDQLDERRIGYNLAEIIEKIFMATQDGVKNEGESSDNDKSNIEEEKNGALCYFEGTVRLWYHGPTTSSHA